MQVSGQLDAVTLFELVATESVFPIELEVLLAQTLWRGEKNCLPLSGFEPKLSDLSVRSL
jgi:hypothetical protein